MKYRDLVQQELNTECYAPCEALCIMGSFISSVNKTYFCIHPGPLTTFPDLAPVCSPSFIT